MNTRADGREKKQHVSYNLHHPHHCYFAISNVYLPLALSISWHSGRLTITVAVCAGRR